MRSTKRFVLTGIAVVLTAVLGGACGGVSNAVSSCTVGQSIVCGGAGGCAGFQVCKADGTYDVCNCSGSANGDGGASSSDGGGDAAGGSDAGNEASPGDAGNFTPADLPGLALWLDDTVGIVTDPEHADQVVHWLDQSGNGNDATGQCTQSCPGTPPTLDPGGAHGHDAIICNDNDFTINDSASLRFGTGDWGLAFVFKTPTSGGVTIYQKSDGSDPPLSFASSSPTAYSVADGVTTAGATVPFTTSFSYFVMRGPAMFLETSSGTSTGGTATGDVSNPGPPITLCNNNSLNNGPAEIAEVIAVKGSLSDDDVTHLITYFKKKFGI